MGAAVREGASNTRRRGRRRGNRVKPMSEINVTPFVDVMLVLLIIFMVAAPLLTVGVPVELPETRAEALPSPEEEPLTVTLTAEGVIMIQTSETAAEDLVPKLQAVAAERADRKIYLRADGELPYQTVAQVMGALNAGGFRDIGLVTEQGGPDFGAPSGQGG